MFTFHRLPERSIQKELDKAKSLPSGSPRFLSFGESSHLDFPRSFVVDQSESILGSGRETFDAARRLFGHWEIFDLGWVRVVNNDVPIVVGQIVAVEVQSLGLWSFNLSRIVEVHESQNAFGFIYATTPHHVEQGEEKFLVELNDRSGEVKYRLEAMSRPRSLLAKLGYPVTRSFQHKFARDSQRRMQQAVQR